MVADKKTKAQAKKKAQPKAKAQKKAQQTPTMAKNDLINRIAEEYRGVLERVDAIAKISNLADFQLAKQRLEESWHWVRQGIERLPESPE